MADPLYRVIQITNDTHGRSYITITQRNPSTFLRRVLQLVRQEWDGQHYRKAQGPARLIEDVEAMDAKHKEEALKRDEREGGGPIQGFRVVEHHTTSNWFEAKDKRDTLIQLERTWHPDKGYNQGWRQRSREQTEPKPIRQRPSDKLPPWQGDTAFEQHEGVTLRLVPPRQLPRARVAGRSPSVKWPPKEGTMELKYDPD